MKHTVEEINLSTGTKGLLVDIPSADVMRLIVSYNSGFEFGDLDRYELPHVLEHMMGCGTKTYPAPNEFKATLELNGAFRNAHTSSRYNSYEIDFADFELWRILDLFEEYQGSPTFPEEAWPTELSNVREELVRNTSQYNAVLNTVLRAQTYPWSVRTLDERLEQLPQLTLAQARDHYHRTHTQRNARVYLVGNIGQQRDKVLRRLERIFAQLPVGERLEPSHEMGHSVPTPILVEETSITPIYYELRGFVGPFSERERVAATLMSFVMGASWKSRIYAEARRRGLAYHLEAFAGGDSYNGLMGFSGFATRDNLTPLLELFVTAVRDIRDGGVGEDELTATKNFLTGTFKREYQTPRQHLGWYWGRYDDEGTYVTFDQYYDLVADVAPADIEQIADKLTSTKTTAAGFLGNLTPVEAKKYHDIAQNLWQ